MGKTIDLQKWAEKAGVGIGALRKIKAKEGKKVSTDQKLTLLYEYMSQFKQMRTCNKITYKKDTCDVHISSIADEIAENIELDTLIDVFSNQLTPISINDDWAEDPIMWGKVSKKTKSSFDWDDTLSDEDCYIELLKYVGDNTYDHIQHMERMYPLCRYADSDCIRNVITFIKITENSKRCKPESVMARSALLLSDTKEAKDYFEKKELLHKYNALRE